MKEKINILYFLNSLTRGGVEHHVLDLIKNLNHDYYKIHLAIPPALAEQIRDTLSLFDVELIEVEIRSWFQFSEIIRFLSFLKKKNIILVHSHLYYASRFCNPIAKIAGVPIVIETAHIEEYWRVGWKKFFILFDYIASLFADKIIAVSNSVKYYYINEKKISSAKISVVHNGVDFSKLQNKLLSDKNDNFIIKKFKIHPNDKIIAVIGRLHPQKGHTYLLEAATQILAQFPNCNFILAGDGELREPLENLANNLGIRDKIIFTGFIEQIGQVYEIADIIVLPSLYEGLPLTAIEASYMARPLIATSVSGTPEIIIDEQTGLLVPPKNSDAIAEAVIRLLNYPTFAEKLAIAAKQHVIKNFSIQKQIFETEQIYNTFLKIWEGNF